jgi:hypothetical protein
VPVTTPTPESVALRPETFRLPKPGSGGDKFFGFSRAFYYAGEKKGYWRLLRIRDENKARGITLIPYRDVLRFVRSQMEAQHGEAK